MAEQTRVVRLVSEASASTLLEVATDPAQIAVALGFFGVSCTPAASLLPLLHVFSSVPIGAGRAAVVIISAIPLSRSGTPWAA